MNKLIAETPSDITYNSEATSFKQLHLSAMLSSEAKFDFGELKDKTKIDYMTCNVNGDATETGLIRFF